MDFIYLQNQAHCAYYFSLAVLSLETGCHIAQADFELHELELTLHPTHTLLL